MLEDIMPLEQSQSVVVNIDAELNKMVDNTKENMQLWEWVDFHYELLGVSYGEAELNHIEELFHHSRFCTSSQEFLVVFMEVAKAMKITRWEGTISITKRAGELSTMGRNT